MIIKLFLFFVAGVIQTVFSIIIIRYVTKEKAIHAAAITFLSSLIQLGVLASILSDIQNSVLSIFIFSLGIAIGAYLGIKLKLEKIK